MSKDLNANLICICTGKFFVPVIFNFAIFKQLVKKDCSYSKTFKFVIQLCLVSLNNMATIIIAHMIAVFDR